MTKVNASELWWQIRAQTLILCVCSVELDYLKRVPHFQAQLIKQVLGEVASVFLLWVDISVTFCRGG